ncbi:MAG: hypothetical protein ACI35S_10215 [Anaeroplasma sp.]
MKIKKGLFMLYVGLLSINLLVLLLGIPTYLLGFEKSTINNLVFIGIICGFILLTIIIYLLVHILRKTYFIITKNEISFCKKNIKHYSILVNDILYAEYLCFSFSTILNQSTFGYLKVHTNNLDIFIDMSRANAKKIDKEYFKIKFKK